MMKFLIVLLLLFASCARNATVNGEEIPTYSGNLLAEVDSVNFQRYFSVVDLGEVIPGPMKFRLVIKNTQDRTLTLDTHKESCRCVTVKLHNTKIAPGDELIADVAIEIPTKVPDSRAMQEIGLSSGGEESGRVAISLNYEIKGVLSFQANSLIVHLPRGKKSWETIYVPIVFSSPVLSESIAVESSRPDLLEVVGVRRLKSKNGDKIAHGVECRVALGKVPDYGTSLVLTAVDVTCDVKDELELYLDPQSPVKISPSVIRMRSSEDGFTATAMLTCKVLSLEATRAAGLVPFVSGTFGSKPVDVDITQLGLGVFRLRVKITNDCFEAFDVAPKVVKWDITIADIRSSTETSIIFP